MTYVMRGAPGCWRWYALGGEILLYLLLVCGPPSVWLHGRIVIAAALR